MASEDEPASSSGTGPPPPTSKSPPVLISSPPPSGDSSPRLQPNTVRSKSTGEPPSRSATSPANLQPQTPANAKNQKSPGPSESLAKPQNSSSLDPASSGTSNANANGSGLRWPTSPRIRSPPVPSNTRHNSNSLHVKTSESQDNADVDPSQQLPPQQLRSPVMSPQATAVKIPRTLSIITSTLETVQEGDNSSSPTDGMKKPPPRPNPPEKQYSTANMSIASTTGGNSADIGTDVTDSETDLSKPKPAPKSPSLPPMATKKTSAPPPVPKTRAVTDGSSKNMIVETETVSSIPQSAAPATATERSATAKREDNGTLRQPSREVLKPKKEKKKPAHKRPGVMSGPSSSKADIFEARVASAAEDDDSDSDETFVYETHAQEARARHQQPRHHSRTPSANSIHSLADRRHNNRQMSTHADAQRSVKTKRSMKFASSSHQAAEDEYAEREPGAARTHRNNSHHQKKAPGMPSQHPHLHGFTPTSVQLPMDMDSPFTFSQASKNRKRTSASNSHQSSNENTPISGSPPPYYSYSKPLGQLGSSTVFDFDNERSRLRTERDPLLGQYRNVRHRSTQMSGHRFRDFDGSHRRCKSLRAYSGCCCVSSIILIVLAIAGAFLFATTHPLYDVRILEIENVLATEESLMADLNCIATNPNIVTISIKEMDVNVFAKSQHVEMEAQPHVHRQAIRSRDLHTSESVDEGTDPISDPQTMLLGQILHFDSALTFEPSPWDRIPQNSTGSIRVDKPGNLTEENGSDRWERVIQHPFELIVRGVLTYTLPLSSRIMSSTVSKTVHVDPDAVDGMVQSLSTSRRARRVARRF